MADYDDEEKLCLVCLSCLDGVGPASVRRLLCGAQERGVPLKDLLALPRGALKGDFGLQPPVARAIAAVLCHMVS